LPILRAIHDDKFGENIRDKLKNRYVAIFLQLKEAGAKAVMVLLEYHEEEKEEEEDEVEVDWSEIKEDMKEVEKLHKNVMKGKKTKKASSKKALPTQNSIKKKKVKRAKVEADDTLLDAR
jgi:formaldehyde-activating enzyme involved in methanogenesis